MKPTVTRSARRRFKELQALRPSDPDQLRHFVQSLLGLRVPARALVAEHQAPLDYLAHAFFEDRPDSAAPADVVVWAGRGTGKTLLGAAATLLDLLFKPGIQVRILGGSLEQSARMYRYLRRMLELPAFARLPADPPTQRSLRLINGSGVEVLTQSQTSVRGQHVHKLRCDEVELFKPAIWEAAQLVGRSGLCGNQAVRGSVEALSTMHKPYGLMSRLTRQPGKRVLRWCVIDVIEPCPPQRPCRDCPLWSDCGGLARRGEGFVPLDDLLRHRQRSSDESWNSEMMCRRPRRAHLVYPNFDPAKHVAPTVQGIERTQLIVGARTNHREIGYKILPTRRVLQAAGSVAREDRLVAGMDFGLRSPLVMLWARLRDQGKEVCDRRVDVLEEYAEEGLTLEQHLKRIEQRGWPRPAWIGVDPAGGQRNSHTGLSDIQMLRQRGYVIRAPRTGIADGIERLRRRLDRGTLGIDPVCARLIEALNTYHFDDDHPHSPTPVKDGPDHWCDALRYLIVSLELGGARPIGRRYAAV